MTENYSNDQVMRSEIRRLDTRIDDTREYFKARVDEDLRQRGTYRKPSGYQRWAFGTFGAGTVDVEIDWIRGRKQS